MNFIELKVSFKSCGMSVPEETAKCVLTVVSKKYELAYCLVEKDFVVLVVDESSDLNQVKQIVVDEFKSRIKGYFDVNSVKFEEKTIDKNQLIMMQMTKPATVLDVKGAEQPSSESTDSPDDKPEDSPEIVFPKSQEEPTAPASVSDTHSTPEQRVEKAKSTKTLQKIRALVGASEFKSLAEEIALIAPVVAKSECYDILTSRSYLFSIGDGNGLTTYLNLFADLLEELGLFTFDPGTRVIEHKIPTGPAADVFKGAFNRLSEKASRGRLVCFDISEWMSECDSVDFRTFLSELPDYAGKNIIVFRVPFIENEVVSNLNNVFNDRLTMRQISILPFDNSELIACAKKTIKDYGFSVNDDVWDVFETRIIEEKNDGRFYGVETVNKIVRDMIYLKQLYMAQHNSEDSTIKKNEILGLSSTYNNGSTAGLDVLKSMVGMEKIAEKVVEIVTQIEASSRFANLERPCVHMRFVGSPGTGKTTVARVIGQILKEKGILRNGSFFEHQGRSFCGRYVGETAPKTAAMCRDAYGSVLFIDEAYSLYRGEHHSDIDYGREAIDTLISEMENHRRDLVVIMAGYPDEMENLMKSNPGLESRMPYIIEFPNYNRHQLVEIFMRMVNGSFTAGEGLENAVKDYFDNIPDTFLESKEFSNARFVRNLFERTWGKTILRTQMNNIPEVIVEKEDFIAASSSGEFSTLLPKKKTVGFV